MKTILCFILSTVLLLAISHSEETGLFLRAIVEEGTSGSQPLTDKDGAKVFVSSTAIITPDDIESAAIEGDDDVTIHFQFKASAQPKLEKATKSLIGEKLAIIIDGKLISAPVVRGSFSSAASVAGNFTREWAEAVVKRANAKDKD